MEENMEMDPDELWDTTMSPNSRNLLKVIIEDDNETNEVLDELFNSNNTDKRKAFLINNSTKIKEIDLY